MLTKQQILDLIDKHDTGRVSTFDADSFVDELLAALSAGTQGEQTIDWRYRLIGELDCPEDLSDEAILERVAVLVQWRKSDTQMTDAARDAKRLDWLMQQVCCDDIPSISIEFGLSREEHFAEFRRQIDAEINRIKRAESDK